MSFIYPSFLWALLLITIRIVIHLLNLRKHQTVYFSNVNLLKIVRKETKRKSKLKQYLILACRILMIVAIVLAFSKPYIPKGESEKQMANNIVAIYIDNSYSMNAEGTEGRAIESAKERAYAIVNGSRPDTKFALLTNSLSGFQNRFFSKSEILRLIADVEVSHNFNELSTIQRRIINLSNNFLLKTNKTAYIISDFQKHTTDLQNTIPDSTLTYNFVIVPTGKIANLYIDTCWFNTPTHHLNQLETINVKIINKSDQDYFQVPVNLFINDTLKSLASIDIVSDEEKTIELQFANQSAGIQSGRIEITDYPITHDNVIYFTFEVKEKQRALLIQSANNKLSLNMEALFATDNFVELDIERADRLQISTLTNYSTLFINELREISTGLSDELTKFTQNGGTLVLIPAPSIETNSYNYLLNKLKTNTIYNTDTIQLPIDNVVYTNMLYNGVFKEDNQEVALPDIKLRYRFNTDPQLIDNTILSFADNSKALSSTNVENGLVYIFSFPLSFDGNQFIDHLLFMPTVYNIALQSSYFQQLYYTIGTDHIVDIKTSDNISSQNIYLRNQQTGIELLPNIIQQRGTITRMSVNGDLDAGFYSVFSNNTEIGKIAFNYMLKESELSYYTSDDLLKMANDAQIKNINLIETNIENMATKIDEIDNGIQLWRTFILLAFVLLISEALIIRFWK
ncbi:MAG TPA: BatA domain-containing protein [Prolixibacteraceae bacterium]|nr:BatA domain-containing protein [Prolixibacteraceae bacterium]